MALIVFESTSRQVLYEQWETSIIPRVGDRVVLNSVKREYGVLQITMQKFPEDSDIHITICLDNGVNL